MTNETKIRPIFGVKPSAVKMEKLSIRSDKIKASLPGTPSSASVISSTSTHKSSFASVRHSKSTKSAKSAKSAKSSRSTISQRKSSRVRTTPAPLKLRRSDKLQSLKSINSQEQEQDIRRILAEIMSAKFAPQDWKDCSTHPSYSRFADIASSSSAPRERIVAPQPRNRYAAARKKYEKQFQREIQQIAAHQDRAGEAMHFLGFMYVTSLWPPLHTHREIGMLRRYFPQLTPTEQRRLEYLRSNSVT